MPIDLHLHSTHSDGTLTPAEEVPPTASTEGEEPTKPRVEDYLYQL